MMPRKESPTRRSRGCRIAVTLALFLGAIAVACVSLESLRQRRYAEVETAQIEAAADSDDAEVIAGLVGLVETRLEDPAAIPSDHAVEALLSLRQISTRDAAAVVRQCATDDPDEEVRYHALDALVVVDPEGSRETLQKVAVEDKSDLVREHASELLEKL